MDEYFENEIIEDSGNRLFDRELSDEDYWPEEYDECLADNEQELDNG